MSKKRMPKTAIHERIELLEKQSDLIRQELGDELEMTKKRALDIGKVALGIGGGLIVSALILRGVFGGQRDEEGGKYKQKRVYHKFKDQLLGEISSQALAFILSIAKDRIQSFVDQNDKAENDGSEFTDRE